MLIFGDTEEYRRVRELESEIRLLRDRLYHQEEGRYNHYVNEHFCRCGAVYTMKYKNDPRHRVREFDDWLNPSQTTTFRYYHLNCVNCEYHFQVLSKPDIVEIRGI